MRGRRESAGREQLAGLAGRPSNGRTAARGSRPTPMARCSLVDSSSNDLPYFSCAICSCLACLSIVCSWRGPARGAAQCVRAFAGVHRPVRLTRRLGGRRIPQRGPHGGGGGMPRGDARVLRPEHGRLRWGAADAGSGAPRRKLRRRRRAPERRRCAIGGGRCSLRCSGCGSRVEQVAGNPRRRSGAAGSQVPGGGGWRRRGCLPPTPASVSHHKRLQGTWTASPRAAQARRHERKLLLKRPQPALQRLHLPREQRRSAAAGLCSCTAYAPAGPPLPALLEIRPLAPDPGVGTSRPRWRIQAIASSGCLRPAAAASAAAAPCAAAPACAPHATASSFPCHAMPCRRELLAPPRARPSGRPI